MPAALSRSLRSPRVVIALCMILCIVFCAVFASRIAPNDPGDQNLLSILTPPFWVEGSDPAFVLGTDSLGRDVLSRLIYGARTAMLVAFFASLGAMIVGTILAHVSGYFGGDHRLGHRPPGRRMDVISAGHSLAHSDGGARCRSRSSHSCHHSRRLDALLSRFTQRSVGRDAARLCRAARLLGFTHWQAITREVLPATLPLLITLMSLEMAIAVVVEAILSFVGLGVGANQPAWGQMIADARQYVYQSPWNLLLPALAIFLTVTSFNLLGDGLRRTLDVRLAESGR